MSGRNYARPRRVRSHAVEAPAALSSYRFFDDVEGPPTVVLANPTAFDVFRITPGFEAALAGVHLIGVGPELAAAEVT